MGLRLTSLVARIVMDEWASLFLTRIVDSGVKVHAMMKYVDDINLILAMIKIGSRWRGEKLVHSQEWEEEDRATGKTGVEITMDTMRMAADSVFSWLKFTVDTPEEHDEMMVPVLDIQVWVKHPKQEEEQGLGSDTLAWTIFEKPCSTKRVLRAGSALEWRSKIVTPRDS